jgi:DNA-binding transcriptional LysR family regulator
MDWDKLRIFHAVAEAGSFTHAGDTLNLSQSAVSRQISALEDSLKAPLFHRHARGLILTEQGEMLFDTVRDVFAKLSGTEARLAESREKPSGLLRVTTTVALGSVWLAPRIREFLELYPDIRVSILTDDDELDLGMREADCAIRMHPPRQSDLVQRPLLAIHVHVFAREPILRVNNVYGILRAVENGAGLAAFPDYMAQESSKIVQVLPDLEGPTFEAYFVYPEEMRNSKRIAVFRDFLVRKVAETQF